MNLFRYLLSSLIFLTFFAACNRSVKPATDKLTFPEEKDPELISRQVIDDLLSRPDFMMYNTGTVRAVHYAEACAGFGAVRLAGFLNDEERLKALSDRYMRVLDEEIENTANHVYVNVYGILPLEVYRHKKEKRFLDQGLNLAIGQWEKPLPDGLTSQTRYWIDDIWMIASLQIQAYRTTGELVYLERAALETDSYIQKLQQPNGLFYHGENAPFYWGRGNGWVAAGFAELLSELPESNTHYAPILAGYRKMMNALLEYQSADGMWHQLIDNKNSYKETSSTAMFGYAMTIGSKKGILKGEAYRDAYLKAWNSLTDYINEEGKISNVCVGTPKSDDVIFYLNRPTVTGDLHGQAPVLWFAYSLLADY